MTNQTEINELYKSLVREVKKDSNLDFHFSDKAYSIISKIANAVEDSEYSDKDFYKQWDKKEQNADNVYLILLHKVMDATSMEEQNTYICKYIPALCQLLKKGNR